MQICLGHTYTIKHFLFARTLFKRKFVRGDAKINSSLIIPYVRTKEENMANQENK